MIRREDIIMGLGWALGAYIGMFFSPLREWAPTAAAWAAVIGAVYWSGRREREGGKL